MHKLECWRNALCNILKPSIWYSVFTQAHTEDTAKQRSNKIIIPYFCSFWYLTVLLSSYKSTIVFYLFRNNSVEIFIGILLWLNTDWNVLIGRVFHLKKQNPRHTILEKIAKQNLCLTMTVSSRWGFGPKSHILSLMLCDSISNGLASIEMYHNFLSQSKSGTRTWRFPHPNYIWDLNISVWSSLETCQTFCYS